MRLILNYFLFERESTGIWRATEREREREKKKTTMTFITEKKKKRRKEEAKEVEATFNAHLLIRRIGIFYTQIRISDTKNFFEFFFDRSNT